MRSRDEELEERSMSHIVFMVRSSDVRQVGRSSSFEERSIRVVYIWLNVQVVVRSSDVEQEERSCPSKNGAFVWYTYDWTFD